MQSISQETQSWSIFFDAVGSVLGAIGDLLARIASVVANAFDSGQSNKTTMMEFDSKLADTVINFVPSSTPSDNDKIWAQKVLQKESSQLATPVAKADFLKEIELSEVTEFQKERLLDLIENLENDIQNFEDKKHLTIPNVFKKSLGENLFKLVNGIAAEAAAQEALKNIQKIYDALPTDFPEEKSIKKHLIQL